MSLLTNLQSILGNQQLGSPVRKDSGAGGLGDLAGGLMGGLRGNMGPLLGPAALGGLAGLLLGGGKLKNAVMFGGGAALASVLWDKYKGRLQNAQPQAQNAPPLALEASRPDVLAATLIKAMVFAAKSDGHIDAREQQAIYKSIQEMNLGADAEAIVQQAMNEPLDPGAIARNVRTPEEAMEVFLVSCSVIEVDHFMESSYLDALGKALHIPPDVQAGILKDIQQAKAE